MNILFVVHRTYPYPGGSEYNVKVISEELSLRGHNISILTDCFDGEYSNVKITSDKSELFNKKYDWVIIHGSDMPAQNFALDNIENIKCKTLYWIIFPSNSKYGLNGLNHATVIGYGTTFDLDHIKKHGFSKKSHFIRYSINPVDCIGEYGFKINNNIETSKMILSPAKYENEVIEYFKKSNLDDTTLVITGYRPVGLSTEKNIKTFYFNDRKDYFSALLECDWYLSNSYEEGFGLVILDCMLNKKPWFCRATGGAADLEKYGTVFNDLKDVFNKIKNDPIDIFIIKKSYSYVISDRMSVNIGDDFDEIFRIY